MANRSPIEWVANYNEDGTVTEGYTVNPIRFRPNGSDKLTTMCQKVSPGCTNCYAESIVRRFWPKDAKVAFPGFTAYGVSEGDFVLDDKQLQSILKIKKPAKVFWGDMCDIFLDKVPDAMIDACFAVCALTPHLTHMFLTKRPERMLKYVSDPGRFDSVRTAAVFLSKGIQNEWSWPLPNVMLGTSAENQKYFDERIGYINDLEEIGWNTFLSLEPLIGEIDVEYPKSIYPNGAPMCCSGHECGCQGMPTEPPMIFRTSLVIVGGESGNRARPMNPDWARKIRDACNRWSTRYFFKQWGAWGPIENGELTPHPQDWDTPPAYHVFPNENKPRSAWEEVWLVGKKHTGHILDGKTHHEFPSLDRRAQSIV